MVSHDDKIDGEAKKVEKQIENNGAHVPSHAGNKLTFLLFADESIKNLSQIRPFYILIFCSKSK